MLSIEGFELPRFGFHKKSGYKFFDEVFFGQSEERYCIPDNLLLGDDVINEMICAIVEKNIPELDVIYMGQYGRKIECEEFQNIYFFLFHFITISYLFIFIT